jgi:glycosyltransferase involved in cell wall biosynthesis
MHHTPFFVIGSPRSGTTLVRMTEPRVSVCVVTYNHGPYIRQCLEGILKQRTSFAFEICIGEDASSDETRLICREFARADPVRIRLFERRREDVIHINGRPTGRFNFLETVAACRGEYIAHCEGDDYWTDPEKLQMQVEAMDARQDCLLCSTKAQCRSGDRLFDYGMAGLPEKTEYDLYDLLRHNIAPSCTRLWRNTAQTREFFELSRGVFLIDWAFNILCARHHPVLRLDRVTAVYRHHAGGIWAGTDPTIRMRNTLQTFEILQPHFRGEPCRRFEQTRNWLAFYVTLQDMRQGKPTKQMRATPGRLRIWAATPRIKKRHLLQYVLGRLAPGTYARLWRLRPPAG